MEPGTTLTLKMRPEKYKFLDSVKNQCFEKSSYYECLGAKFAEKFEKSHEKYGADLCSPKDQVKKCSPFPFPNIQIYNISICPFEPINNKQFKCAEIVWQGIYKEIHQNNKVLISVQFRYTNVTILGRKIASPASFVVFCLVHKKCMALIGPH